MGHIRCLFFPLLNLNQKGLAGKVNVVDWWFSRQGPARLQQKWTGKFWVAGKKTAGGMYSLVYQKYSKTETVREFRQKEGKVPWNLSRLVLLIHYTQA